MAILARGTTGSLTSATNVSVNADLSGFGRQVTLVIAYDDLTTYTGVNAILEWGLVSEGAAFAAGANEGGTADTALAGTANGVYSKAMHVGGDVVRVVLTPQGTPGSVTVHWAIIG